MKDERINQPFPRTETSYSLDRRRFLKTVGGGIVVFFGSAFPGVVPEPFSAPAGEPVDDFNAFLRIAPEGRVTCFTGKIEMGQGIIISLAQMLAEELDVPLDSVDMVMGDTDLCPWDAGTFGSRTTKYFGPVLQTAAARGQGRPD